jgi:molecular chaperone GrpE
VSFSTDEASEGKGNADGEETATLDDVEGGDAPLSEEAEIIEVDSPWAAQSRAEASDLKAERDQYLDSLRRLQADFENYKKRVAKQQADILERANEGLVTKLLPVLDNADLAEAHGSGNVAQLRAGLLDVLGKAGLERIAPDGGPFDPNLHDAVAHEPGDGGEQEVAEVLRAGYRWNGRVLRPAMVKVRG